MFASFLKTLVDIRTDLSWFQHRDRLADGEVQTLRRQFAPYNSPVASAGVEMLTKSKAATDGLFATLTSLLFTSPPTTRGGVQSHLRKVFKDSALPVRLHTSGLHANICGQFFQASWP
ncbi:MAG: hypothetical protein HC767_00010 [Akkermansiaceae bacterium]|nr:hypothetical protein [Akkermansiaceae bacterium]